MQFEKSLRGVDVLINNYWVRFVKPPQFTFTRALANSKVLFDAAKCASVGRIIHISITNPDRESTSPISAAKRKWRTTSNQPGYPDVILRPTVLFGKEDILINNIAWALRYLPVFGIYGDGRYRLQPIYVDDLAAAVVERLTGEADETIDAIGAETFRYREMVEMISREIDSLPLIVPMSPMLAYQSVRLLGWLVGCVNEFERICHDLLPSRYERRRRAWLGRILR